MSSPPQNSSANVTPPPEILLCSPDPPCASNVSMGRPMLETFVFEITLRLYYCVSGSTPSLSNISSAYLADQATYSSSYSASSFLSQQRATSSAYSNQNSSGSSSSSSSTFSPYSSTSSAIRIPKPSSSNPYISPSSSPTPRPRASLMSVRLQRSLQSTSVELWTNLPTKRDPSATWHAEPMELLLDSELEPHLVPEGFSQYSGMFRSRIYSLTLVGVSPGDYEATYRLVFQPPPSSISQEFPEPIIKWLGKPGQNIKLYVHHPNLNDRWTLVPDYKELLPIRNLFIANYVAAMQSKRLGFNAVMSLAYELPTPSDLEEGFDTSDLCRFPMLDGAANALPTSWVKDAVEWIETKLSQGKRVCVHDRAGIGRAGSIAIAVLYKRFSHFTFEQACQAAWAIKTSIYPHTQLRETLEELYPRSDIDSLTPHIYISQQQQGSFYNTEGFGSRTSLSPVSFFQSGNGGNYNNGGDWSSSSNDSDTYFGNYYSSWPRASQSHREISLSPTRRRFSFNRLNDDEGITDQSRNRRTSRSPSSVRLVKKAP